MMVISTPSLRGGRQNASSGLAGGFGARPLMALIPCRRGAGRRLLGAGCVRLGQFTLKSGLSPSIDLRQLISDPSRLADAGNAYVKLLRDLPFDRLAALPYAALPIATAISLAGGWPMIYPRGEAKAYGTGAEIEGASPGERAVVIDDLATTGGSKFEAIEKLTAAGLMSKMSSCWSTVNPAQMSRWRPRATVCTPSLR